jgi:hypothetical protein
MNADDTKLVTVENLKPGMVTISFFIVVSVQLKHDHVKLVFITPKGEIMMYHYNYNAIASVLR